MKKNKIFLVTLAPKSHRTSEENLGIEYLKSSLVSKNFQVELIDAWLNEMDLEDVYKKIIEENEKILFVGISSYMGNTKPTIELINRLKQFNQNIKVVCGGFGPTFYPIEYLESNADFVIRGEGEEAICELADCIQNNKSALGIKNVGYKDRGEVILNGMRCLQENLDSIPFPCRDDLKLLLAKKSSVNMLTARGCSGNCEFCSVISFFRLSNGKVWRTRSIENIVDEIEMLVKKGVTLIKIVDDSFVDGLRDENWCCQFADEIERRNIKVRLRGQIRADKVTDSILKNLKRAGFYSFACGIENGSSSALSRMNKKATLEDNKKALQLFKKYGYIVQMGYILFDKDTTLKELNENYEFMKEYDFAITKGIFSEMYSAEGTLLNDKLRENNELEESDFIKNNNKYFIKEELVKKIYDCLKLWHKSHSEIYDMTIDPLTAPKSIPEFSIKEFYEYVMVLKKNDLEILKKILTIVKENSSIDLCDYVKECIKNMADEYQNIEVQVRKLYKKNNLIYNATSNPFI